MLSSLTTVQELEEEFAIPLKDSQQLRLPPQAALSLCHGGVGSGLLCIGFMYVDGSVPTFHNFM